MEELQSAGLMSKNCKMKIIKTPKWERRHVKIGEEVRGSYKSNTPNRKTKRVDGSIFCVQEFNNEVG